MRETAAVAASPPVPAPLPRPAEHIAQGFIDGDLVLYDSKRTRVHVLNGTAAFVWALCDDTHTPAEIVSVLGEHYPAHDREIEADVAGTLKRFYTEGLFSV